MAVMHVAQRMTADEFLVLPEREDNRRLELVEGELVVNEPLPLHARAQLELAYALHHWLRAKPGRGTVWLPVDVQLDDRNVYAPDLLWYPPGGEPRLDQRPSPRPALAVEIRSPSTWRYNVGAKKAAYERHGLPELWLIDTYGSAALVFRRSASATQRFDVALELAATDSLSSPLLPGFELALGDVLRPSG